MFFSGVVSLRRLRAILALELTELRLCFYAKNKRRNFHSACSAALLFLSRVARGALFVGGPVLVPQFCGNLGDTILKLTVRTAERPRRWQRRQFVRLVLFPAGAAILQSFC